MKEIDGLIYQIRWPGCPFMEVNKQTYDNPPQYAWQPKIHFEKRILKDVTLQVEQENKHE